MMKRNLIESTIFLLRLCQVEEEAKRKTVAEELLVWLRQVLSDGGRFVFVVCNTKTEAWLGHCSCTGGIRDHAGDMHPVLGIVGTLIAVRTGIPKIRDQASPTRVLGHCSRNGWRCSRDIGT